jgi:hypothetical protein
MYGALRIAMARRMKFCMVICLIPAIIHKKRKWSMRKQPENPEGVEKVSNN